MQARPLTSAGAIAGLFLASQLAAQSPPASLPGIRIIPPTRIDVQQVAVRSLLTKITVHVNDGVATTEVVETIRNDGPIQAEADWLLPLPADAAVDGFEMTVGGKPMPAEILDSGRARSIYEQIVRSRRDPGLLEYVDSGLLRARVFPIPPQGQIDVKVRWRHVLPATAGLATYRFPLRAQALGGRPAERIALTMKLDSRAPLRGLWSPLPGLDIRKTDDHHAVLGFEASAGQVPSRDLEVFYTTGTGDFGMTVLPYRKAGKDGHVLMMVTPKHEWQDDPHTVRSIQFVLDTSGSMQGEKIAQARKALEFFVGSLRATDRFNIIPFSTEARPLFPTPSAANADNLAAARALIGGLEARGGTNIDDAITRAIDGVKLATAEPGSTIVPIVVFLTDGLPTVGETDAERLLARHTKAAAEHGARIFAFGVGHDVNTKLLDALAERSRGDRDYVREGEDIEHKTSALFDKLSHPVLTDLELLVDGIALDGIEPRRLPDLFRGSRLIVLARYKGDGQKAIRLRGKVNGQAKELVFEATFPAESMTHDFVPQLWAQRRVVSLLDAIRLNGAPVELVDEVTLLGKEYGIATPYTSHLIVEEGMQIAQTRGVDGNAVFFLGQAGDDRARELLRAGVSMDLDGFADGRLQRRLHEEAAESRDALGGLAKAPASGEQAVERSLELKALAAATPGSSGPATVGPGTLSATGSATGRGAVRDQTVASLARRMAGRTFLMIGGVWVDQNYREEMRGKEQKLEAFSSEYFALLAAHPELKPVFAFSTAVVIVLDGKAIEIVAAKD
jgi:Ca-activated chloride channel family protein